MKTGVDDIVEELEERFGPQYMDDLTPEEMTEEVLQILVDLELPELEEHLEKYDGKKFTTIGKIKFLNEIEEKTGGL